jgi:hypothetical protein
MGGSHGISTCMRCVAAKGMCRWIGMSSGRRLGLRRRAGGGPLLSAFDLDATNARAEIDDVEIDDVVVDADGDVRIHYTYTWSAFYGCDDMNKTDQTSGAVLGQKTDDKWLFEHHVRLQRSTLDEF